MTDAEFKEAWDTVRAGADRAAPNNAERSAAWKEYLARFSEEIGHPLKTVDQVPKKKREEFIAAAMLVWG